MRVGTVIVLELKKEFCFGKTTYFYHVQQFKSIVMKTVNQKFRKVAAWATYGFAAMTILSCNTYQGVVEDGDGIYGNTYAFDEANAVDSKNNYYQQYFSTKAAQIEEISEEDLVFTDIDAYSSQESMDEEGYIVVQEEYIDDYGSWGSNGSDINVNVYGGWNNGFFGNGWNLGYWYGGWNAGYWGGFRPWGFNYWNNPFWGYSSYWGYSPYWGWNNAFYNPWFFGNGWGYGHYYNPWFFNNGGYSTIANRGRSNQDRRALRGQTNRGNVGSRENSQVRGRSSSALNRGRGSNDYRRTSRLSNRGEFDLNRGRNTAVRNNRSVVRGNGNQSSSMVRSRYNPNNRGGVNSNVGLPNGAAKRNSKPVAVSTSRPTAQNSSPSNAAKNFKIKRRSRPNNSTANSRPTSPKKPKAVKAENANQRSFNRPSFQNSRPMSSPRNYSRPSAGRGSVGRGGRG